MELFFERFEQNLKIKRFPAENPKAVRLRIVTALIACVLLNPVHRSQRITIPLVKPPERLRPAFPDSSGRRHHSGIRKLSVTDDRGIQASGRSDCAPEDAIPSSTGA